MCGKRLKERITPSVDEDETGGIYGKMMFSVQLHCICFRVTKAKPTKEAFPLRFLVLSQTKDQPC